MTCQKSTDTVRPAAEIALADLAAVVGGTTAAPHVREIAVTKQLGKDSTKLF